MAILPAAGTDWDPVAEQLALAALFADFGATASIATQQTRSNNTFGDLATAGPSVTLTSKGTWAAVWFGAVLWGSVGATPAAASGRVAVQISGATVMAAAASNGFYASESAGLGVGGSGCQFRLYPITPGVNTFKLQYNNIAANGTATFQDRTISVLAP